MSTFTTFRAMDDLQRETLTAIERARTEGYLDGEAAGRRMEAARDHLQWGWAYFAVGMAVGVVAAWMVL